MTLSKTACGCLYNVSSIYDVATEGGNMGEGHKSEGAAFSRRLVGEEVSG